MGLTFAAETADRSSDRYLDERRRHEAAELVFETDEGGRRRRSARGL